LPGISLKPFLTGEEPRSERKYIITESYNANQITDGRYKYTVYELPGYPEIMTDLQTDPGETVNVSANPAYQAVREDLKKRLMADLSRRGLTPLPQNRTIENIRAQENASKPDRKNNDPDRD